MGKIVTGEDDISAREMGPPHRATALGEVS